MAAPPAALLEHEHRRRLHQPLVVVTDDPADVDADNAQVADVCSVRPSQTPGQDPLITHSFTYFSSCVPHHSVVCDGRLRWLKH